MHFHSLKKKTQKLVLKNPHFFTKSASFKKKKRRVALWRIPHSDPLLWAIEMSSWRRGHGVTGESEPTNQPTKQPTNQPIRSLYRSKTLLDFSQFGSTTGGNSMKGFHFLISHHRIYGIYGYIWYIYIPTFG